VRIFDLFRTLLKYGMPAFLVLVPVLALYGWLAPWPPMEAALRDHSGQLPLLVGTSSSSQYELGGGSRVISSRSYVLLPAVVADPKILTLTQENDGAITSSESRAGFFFTLAWLGVCVFGTWWFWRVPTGGPSEPKPLRGAV
jgi:hypothetical protein